MRNLVKIAVLAAVATSCGTGSPSDYAASEVAAILAGDSAANPYELCLDSMPDGGCVKMKINYLGANLGRYFNDSNYRHYAAAESLGIAPLTSMQTIWDEQRPLVEVRTCREYFVEPPTHSYPYLVPEAAELLSDIGSAFNDSLRSRGGGSYRIKVTSLLRSPLSVSRLRRVNRNAVDSSTHQFGTTFDISYSKFICDSQTVNRTQEDLKNLLGEVLADQRRMGRCFVKYERRQSCYHITVRPSSH